MSKEILNELKQIKKALTCGNSFSSTGTSDTCCPQTNNLLGQIETAINNLDISNTYANDTFQVTDCEGLPIGTLQDIKKTVVLNTTTTSICNVQEIADAINAIAPATYNNVSHYLLDSTNPILTIPANTVHSISYKIINATVDISIDGINLPYVLGESDMEEATTLIANEYIFDATNGKVKVKTIN
jgi:hypothetical protein